MSGVRCTKTNLANIFIFKTLSRNATLVERFGEICETEVCLSKHRQYLVWNCCIQSRELLSNVHQSISFDGLISHISILKRLARIHRLFQTLMPYQQQSSSVSETQHQVSNGKIQQVFLFCASLSASHLPENQWAPTVVQMAHQRHNQTDSGTREYHSQFCQCLKIFKKCFFKSRIVFFGKSRLISSVIVAQNSLKQRKWESFFLPVVIQTTIAFFEILWWFCRDHITTYHFPEVSN